MCISVEDVNLTYNSSGYRECDSCKYIIEENLEEYEGFQWFLINVSKYFICLTASIQNKLPEKIVFLY